MNGLTLIALFVACLTWLELYEQHNEIKQLKSEKRALEQLVVRNEEKADAFNDNVVGMAWDVHSLQYNQEILINERDDKDQFAPINRDYN